METERASHVEPTKDNRWKADMDPICGRGVRLGPFDTRVEALEAERVWVEGYLRDPVAKMAEHGLTPLEPEKEPELTLNCYVADYCRWESASRAETAREMARWLEDLERVGAEITNLGDCEVNFRMTLRQAFEIDWGWDEHGDPAHYLAGHLEEPFDGEVDEFDHKDSEHPLTLKLQRLWDAYLDEKGAEKKSVVAERQ
jgi:hypothetical protein